MDFSLVIKRREGDGKEAETSKYINRGEKIGISYSNYKSSLKGNKANNMTKTNTFLNY